MSQGQPLIVPILDGCRVPHLSPGHLYHEATHASCFHQYLIIAQVFEQVVVWHHDCLIRQRMTILQKGFILLTLVGAATGMICNSVLCVGVALGGIIGATTGLITANAFVLLIVGSFTVLGGRPFFTSEPNQNSPHQAEME